MENNLKTENTSSRGMVMVVENLVSYFYNQRKLFERRWYDNNFFDDGFHFRYLSRTTGKIVDVSDKDNVTMPSRAIPKASRQIRGVANLLLLPDYVPVIYPEKVSKIQYPPIQQANPQTGMPMQAENPQYQEAVKKSKETAHKVSAYVKKEWERQELSDKLTLMVILAAKHGVSFLQVWPDAVKEEIRSQVFDAFDIYVKGNLSSIYDSPAIIKASPMLISEIHANEMFDERKYNVIPDNKYAQSITKDAYMRSRYGQGMESDIAKTAILKEAFIKEYVSEKNRIQIQETLGEEIAAKYKDGDPIIRQTFVAGGQCFYDKYLDLPEYPFVDFRMEPGPIYGVPLIERFIPANKSLDIVMSRLERYFNTMVTGTWLVRKGENMQITNLPGGQQLEYTTTPPTQAPLANPQTAVFPYINMINQIIEEQGASTSALNQLPQGVKSGVAIESVKQSEYSNLRIPSQQLKKTIKTITERMLDLASKFRHPQTVYSMDKGNPDYFDIIGQDGAQVYDEVGQSLPQDTVVIKKDYHVDIEVEQGLGFTHEGQKKSMEQIVQFFTPLAQAGIVPPEAVKVLAQKTLDAFGFGNTEDFVEAMDEGTVQMNEQQILQLKVALAEVIKEAQLAGKPAEDKAVLASKAGTLEALKESGMAEKIMGKNGNVNKISESMSYKDAPPSIQRQMEAQAGFDPATQEEHATQQAKQKADVLKTIPQPKADTNKGVNQ